MSLPQELLSSRILHLVRPVFEAHEVKLPVFIGHIDDLHPHAS